MSVASWEWMRRPKKPGWKVLIFRGLSYEGSISRADVAGIILTEKYQPFRQPCHVPERVYRNGPCWQRQSRGESDQCAAKLPAGCFAASIFSLDLLDRSPW